MEGKFTAADEAVLDAAELLAALEAGISAGDRQQAIARYLAGGEGWREALHSLRGNFARGAGTTGLKAGKDE